MNIDSYIKRKDFKKIILACGNRPVAYLDDGQSHYLSELVLDKDEILLVLDTLNLRNHLEQFKVESRIYKNGNELLVKSFCFSDTIKLEIQKVEHQTTANLNDLSLPGFVTDWTHSKKGLIFFYGNQTEILEDVQFSFVKERSTNVKGSTLIVNKRDPKILGSKNHFFTHTSDEDFMKNENCGDVDFDTYMLFEDFHLYEPLKLLRLVEKNSLVMVKSPWSSLEKFLFVFNKWAENSSELTKILLSETLGFVGVKSVVDLHNAKRPIFEVTSVEEQDLTTPHNLNVDMFKDKNLSFNRYLYSMLIRREISLKHAYSSSLDPEGLNYLLDKSDQAYGC